MIPWICHIQRRRSFIVGASNRVPFGKSSSVTINLSRTRCRGLLISRVAISRKSEEATSRPGRGGKSAVARDLSRLSALFHPVALFRWGDQNFCPVVSHRRYHFHGEFSGEQEKTPSCEFLPPYLVVHLPYSYLLTRATRICPSFYKKYITLFLDGCTSIEHRACSDIGEKIRINGPSYNTEERGIKEGKKAEQNHYAKSDWVSSAHGERQKTKLFQRG